MILITKIWNVKTPTRGSELSAGLDFYIPEATPEFIGILSWKNGLDLNIFEENPEIKIFPFEKIIIPSGIKVKIPKDKVLVAFNKSGIALKKGLDVGASVVDADYEGEIHIHLTNTTQTIKVLKFGQKAVQFLLLDINYDKILEVTGEELEKRHVLDHNSDRGSGGFGSTGLT